MKIVEFSLLLHAEKCTRMNERGNRLARNHAKKEAKRREGFMLCRKKYV